MISKVNGWIKRKQLRTWLNVSSCMMMKKAKLWRRNLDHEIKCYHARVVKGKTNTFPSHTVFGKIKKSPFISFAFALLVWKNCSSILLNAVLLLLTHKTIKNYSQHTEMTSSSSSALEPAPVDEKLTEKSTCTRFAHLSLSKQAVFVDVIFHPLFLLK